MTYILCSSRPEGRFCQQTWPLLRGDPSICMYHICIRLLFCESHHSCTLLLFFSCASFLHVSRSLMRCIHSCVTFIHASHLLTRRTPDLSHTDTCFHAFILPLFPVMYHWHGIAPSPRFCFLRYQLHTRHYLSCPVSSLPFMYHIHGLMPPSLFALLVMYPVDYPAPHWGATSRWVWDTQLPHSCSLFSLVFDSLNVYLVRLFSTTLLQDMLADETIRPIRLCSKVTLSDFRSQETIVLYAR